MFDRVNRLRLMAAKYRTTGLEQAAIRCEAEIAQINDDFSYCVYCGEKLDEHTKVANCCSEQCFTDLLKLEN